MEDGSFVQVEDDSEFMTTYVRKEGSLAVIGFRNVSEFNFSVLNFYTQEKANN